jgi:thioredoxin reductase (NADPH)
MTSSITESCECAVVGAGPGGLAAAIYLARFHRQVLVFDAGKPRACWSPWNRNYPGFPEGISGAEMVQRFRAQAGGFQVDFIEAPVTQLIRAGAGFCLQAGERAVEARAVILATGVTDVWPDVPNLEALAGRHIRVCPICDAYEASGKRVGLLGSGDKVAREALYLRHFTADVTLFTHGLECERPMAPALQDRLQDDGVAVRAACVRALEPLAGSGTRVCLEGGARVDVDMLFTALGCRANSRLAVELGAQADELGYLSTDSQQQTTVPGLYAVGDVSSAINQVTVAVGQAAIAATAIHNSLLDF